MSRRFTNRDVAAKRAPPAGWRSGSNGMWHRYGVEVMQWMNITLPKSGSSRARGEAASDELDDL
jgi:hypothetical protein